VETPIMLLAERLRSLRGKLSGDDVAAVTSDELDALLETAVFLENTAHIVAITNRNRL